jgi:hypothetical protein
VILPNAGVNGGILLDEAGIRPIPPLPRPVQDHLQGVLRLLRATRGQSAESPIAKDLIVLTTRVANLAIERIEAAIGPLAGEDSLMFLDIDDGFVCSSTGSPPRPIQWPPLAATSIGELVERGLMASDIVDFLRLAVGSGIDINEFLEVPHAVAERLGIQISDYAANALSRLAPSRLNEIANPVDREVVGFLHRVLEDGRYIDNWATEPVAVAGKLDISLSRAATDKILGGAAVAIGPEGSYPTIEDVVVLGIIIGIIAVAAGARPLPETVIDESGIEKF